MEISRACENAATLFQHVQDSNTQFTYSAFHTDKLKTMGYLGRAWERIVDYFTGGSASAARILKVNELVVDTLLTLQEKGIEQFDVSVGFMRSKKKQLGDLAEKISRFSNFNNNATISDLARSIVADSLKV